MQIILYGDEISISSSYINLDLNMWTAGAKIKNLLTDINYDVLDINLLTRWAHTSRIDVLPKA